MPGPGPDQLYFWNALESGRVPDAVLARAYEQVEARARALFKTAIAVAHTAHDRGLPFEEQTRARRYPGMEVRAFERPVAWCALFVDAAYVSRDFAAPSFSPQAAVPGAAAQARSGAARTGASRLPADFHPHAQRCMLSLLPAVLAGVPEVWAVIAGQAQAAHPSLFAAMELAGVENISAVSPDAMPSLLRAAPGDVPGRILVMGAPAWREAALTQHCRNQVRVWCDAGHDRENEEWGYGFQETVSQEAAAWHALEPDLGPAFFRTRRIEVKTWYEDA